MYVLLFYIKKIEKCNIYNNIYNVLMTENSRIELYNNLANDLAKTFIGDGQSIKIERDNNLNITEPFSIITANCNNRILNYYNGKPIYANWFLDDTKVRQTGKISTCYSIFKNAMCCIMKEKLGENHNIYIKIGVKNKKEHIYCISFYHYRNKKAIQK